MKDKSSQLKYLITQEIHKLEEFKESLNEKIDYSLIFNIQVWVKLFEMIRETISDKSIQDCEEIVIIRKNLFDIYTEMNYYFKNENLNKEFEVCVTLSKEIVDLV